MKTEQADRLESCIPLLEQYIKVLRGEAQDMTGRGLWQIIRTRLESTMDIKIITKDQWKAFTGKES